MEWEPWPVYTERDTVGLLLTKTTNQTQGISHCSKIFFFKLFVWQQLPSILLQADFSDNSCLCFSFFPFFFLWQEKSFCHIINSNSVSLPFCLSLQWKQWQNCHECLPHKKAGAYYFELQGHNFRRFLKTLWDLEGGTLLFLCDPAHYKPFFFPYKSLNLQTVHCPVRPKSDLYTHKCMLH